MLAARSELFFALVTFMLLPNAAVGEFSVTVNTETAIAKTSDKFVSVTIDTGVIVKHYATFNPEDPMVIKLSQALYPSYLRVGGTTEDSLIFLRHQSVTDRFPNATFTENDWDRMNVFAQKANFSLIFGLNSLYRPGVAWDPDNALKLLNYSASKGYKLNWELGNEPDLYAKQFNRIVDPQQMGQDFEMLRSILDSIPMYQSSKLVGPDVTNAVHSSTRGYLENFMKTGSKSIDAMTFHQYYLDGHTARPSDFIDVDKLDSLKSLMTAANETIQNFSNGTRTFWLGETSTAYGGGAPGLSNTFLAGFMWLDKLGISAESGAEVVIRQDLVGLNYGLLDYSNGVYTPNPDYWLTLLYKMLVGETVLQTEGGSENLRMYCHCTNSRSGYVSGTVTFYLMNLYNTTQNVSFRQFEGRELHLYVLSSGDKNTLISRSVKLNGKILELASGELPPLPPIVQNSTTLNIAPFTMVFVVIPNADAASCSN